MKSPAWAFFHTKLDPRSATEIPPARPSRYGSKTKESATITPLPARRKRKAQPGPPARDLLATIVASLDVAWRSTS